MIMLGVFTLCEAFLVGMICTFWDVEVVALAFICTCAGVFGLALIATKVSCWTKVSSVLLFGLTVQFQGLCLVMAAAGVACILMPVHGKVCITRLSTSLPDLCCVLRIVM